MFSFFRKRAEPTIPNYSKLIDGQEDFEGLNPFIFDQDIDLKKASKDEIKERCEVYEADDREEKSSNMNPKDYIKLRQKYYPSFPSPESVVDTFQINIYRNLPKLISLCLNKAPYSWTTRFINKEGHNLIFDFLQNTLDKHQMTFITFRDQEYSIIGELLNILFIFTNNCFT